jgi:hypothetical protein
MMMHGLTNFKFRSSAVSSAPSCRVFIGCEETQRRNVAIGVRRSDFSKIFQINPGSGSRAVPCGDTDVRRSDFSKIFQINPGSGSRAVPCGDTEGRTNRRRV